MTKDQEIIKIYKQKIKLLKKHNKSYFHDDNPSISDKYDSLKAEIIELEKNNFLVDLELRKNLVGAPHQKI